MPEVRHSVCALDCPDTCALLINVEDGKGTRLRGDPNHPVTRGFLCGKVAQYLDRQYSPDRLLYPQKRTGAKGQGHFTRISWDEALDTVAAKLQSVAQEFGPESVLPYSYAGTMGPDPRVPRAFDPRTCAWGSRLRVQSYVGAVHHVLASALCWGCVVFTQDPRACARRPELVRPSVPRGC